MTIINIVIDTTCLRLIQSNDVYNYYSGYLYERICWLMQLRNGVANIHLSSRSNLKKKALVDFLASRNNHKFQIDMGRIKDIKIIPNERKKLLQLADCCCSALYQALKYNNETHFKYIEGIYPRFYRNRYGKVISYGLKLVPSDSRAEEVHKLLSFLQSKK
ncbi:MAG: hypothetical protein Q4B29_02640 [Candidatus Saccharibacteria bacterium]|nr:hypothetical protein [Candidatus Saccharibacteria bacterium]